MRPARLRRPWWHAPGLLALGCGIVVAPAPAEGQDADGRAVASRAVPDGLKFANALLRDRRYDLAADQFERFLKGDPKGEDLADARFGLGRARLFLNDYAAARRQFEEFLRIAPDHPNAATAAFRAGEAAYLMNDLPAARKALASYTETYPDHAHRDTALPELGDACFRLNDLAGAKAAYRKALAVEPDGRLANRCRFFLGRTLAGLGETEEARGVLDALAAANDPEWSGKARLQSGQVLLATGRAAEAAEVFAEIERAKTPGVSPAEARLRRAEASVALGRHDEAEALLVPLASEGSRAASPPAAFALAGSRMDRGRWAEARAVCDEAVRRSADSPWVPRLLYRSAEALVKEGKADEARARFLKVAADHPKDAWAASARLRAARLALDGRDPKEAAAIAAEFLEKSPDHPLRADALVIAARAALAQDRPREAVAVLERLLAEEKPGAEVAESASYYLGLAYKADGQPEKAAKLLEGLAGAATPASADAKLVVGFHQFEAKNYSAAAESLEGYLAAKPNAEDAPRALAYLALARRELGQADAAKAALDRLAKDWPKSDALPRARIILAESALEAKRFDDAAATFLAVVESGDPKWKARALSGLGWAQLQGGHPEEAAATFATLLAFAPDDPLAADAALARSRALEAAGKVEEALAALTLVAEKYGKSPEAEAAKVTRARLLARSGKPAEAADELGAFLRDHPKAAPGGYATDDLLVEWGWALHDAGKAAESDAAFRRLLDEFPDGPRAAEARVFLAESLHAAGKPSDAEAMLAPVVADGAKADPDSVQSALLRLAKIALARGDAEAATSRFDRLARDHPDGKYLVDARFGLAEADLKRGKAEAAEARFAELATVSGPDAAKWVPIAKVRQLQCLVALERWDDALKAADAAKADPIKLTAAQAAEVDYCRGRALQQAGANFDAARAAYQAAIDAAPASEVAARSQFMRGETYFHQKNYAESLREFHKTDLSYRAPEWQAAALLEAGKVYGALGRWTEAVDVYEKALANFPKDPRIDEVNRLLGEAKAKAAAPSGDAAPKGG